jgi:multiple sugar transport system permease protein
MGNRLKRSSIRVRFQEMSNLQFAVVLSVPIMLFLVSIIIYPLLYSFGMSFREVNLYAGFRIVFVGLKNYRTVLTSEEFWRSVTITLRFMADTTILTIILGLIFATALSRVERLKGLIRSVVILPWAISSYGTGIIFKYFWRGFSGFPSAIAGNLLNFTESVDFYNTGAVIEILAVATAWHYVPLVAFFLMASIDVIPSRLYDMAEIDHLRFFKRFYIVTLPYLRYTLFVFTSIMMVFSMKEYDIVFLQTGGGPRSAVLTYQIYKESFINLKLGYGSAMSFCLLFMMLGITLFLFFIWGRKENI